ncbi:MAG: sulfur carrier protein ThiS [Bacteroides sp.]|nr:sulfur carrier protein ThiS [Bacteroides sp.]
MKIILNSIPTTLPKDYMTVDDLIEWKSIKPIGTAVAINNKIIRRENWKITRLSDLDQVNIISAAFGG